MLKSRSNRVRALFVVWFGAVAPAAIFVGLLLSFRALSARVPDPGLLMQVVRTVTFSSVLAGAALLLSSFRSAKVQTGPDRLTGLMTRETFQGVLAKRAERALAEGGSLSLCLIRVHDLAVLNASSGPGASDQALVRVTGLIAKAAGEDGVVARIGDDDFALLLPSPSAEARETCARIVREVGQGDLRPGLAVGIAELPGQSADVDGLWRIASGAAYWSRQIGAEDIVVYDPLLVDILNNREQMAQLERETHSKTAETLATAVDARDPCMRGHSRRVADLSELLASEMGLPEERVSMVHAAGLLHDVGKIGVPDSVLMKPTPLTQEELAEIQKHPEIGEKILHSSVRPEMLSWIRAHHERWDGLGYPDGLRGEEIPLEARIISVCDVFHAMGCTRPSRQAASREKILGELRANAGSQFDSAVVEVFLDLVLNSTPQYFEEVAAGSQISSLLHPTLPSLVAEVLEDGTCGPFIEVNEAFSEVYGYDREEVLGMTLAMLEPREIGEPSAAPGRVLVEALRAGEDATSECEWRCRSGNVVALELAPMLVERADSSLLTFTARPLYADAATRRAVERRSHKLEKLVSTTRRLSENLPIHAILRESLECAVELAEARSGGIGLAGAGGFVEYEFLLSDGSRRSVTAGPDDPVCVAVLLDPARHVDNSVGDKFSGDKFREALKIRSLLAVPIRGRDGRPMGVLEVHNSLRAFFEDDAVLLEGLAAAVAIAVENASWLEEMESQRRYLLEQRSRLLSLTSELALTEERERRAIAADLHDGIGQSLQMAKLLVSQATAATDLVETRESLASAQELIAQAIQDTRSLISEISPPMLYDIGLEAALEWLVDKTGSEIGTMCTYTDDGSEKRLPETMRAVVYRMIRELFLNSVKHSWARSIEVRTSRQQDLLLAEVIDDGRGFVGDPSSATFGLRNLREQVGSLGGRLEMESNPGSGTVSRLWVPISEREPGDEG